MVTIAALDQPVSMIMTTGELVTVDERDDVRSVVSVLAQGRVNHIPVLSDGRRLVGVVASMDLLKLERSDRAGPRRISVAEVMTRNIETVRPTTSVRRVAELLSLGDFHSLLVTASDGELLGIVTSGDVLRAILAD
jgi:CBS domain-containing membrane protein